MHVMAPKNKWELSDMMKFAVDFGAPIAIRYPRGEAYDGLKDHRAAIEYGKSEMIYEGKRGCKVAMLAVGSMVKTAEEVHIMLGEKEIDSTLVNARFVKPIDTDMIDAICKKHKILVTMEENLASGGYGEKVLEYVTEKKYKVDIIRVAIPDEYVEHGNVDILKKEIGIDAESVFNKIVEKV